MSFLTGHRPVQAFSHTLKVSKARLRSRAEKPQTAESQRSPCLGFGVNPEVLLERPEEPKV